VVEQLGRGLKKPIYYIPDESCVLHDAHIDAWGRSFFTFRDLKPMAQPPISTGLVPVEEFFHEVKQEPNIQPQDFTRFFTDFYEHTNPHRVTAEQVGIYTRPEGFVDIPPNWESDIIDVEARVVETPKQLEGPHEPEQ
jgi:hypothetical protein